MNACKLKEKSDECKEAGIELENLYKFNSSIHCYYYSVLQRMCFILFQEERIDSEQIKVESDNDSHSFILNRIVTYFHKKNFLSKDEKKEFKKKFYFLKSNRIDADYGTFLFNANKITNINTYTNNLINILEKYEKS